MNPVTKTAPSRIPKCSGILWELRIDLLDKTAISIQNGFAKVGTIDVGDAEFVVGPETNLPLEMLALMASLSDSPC